MADAAQIPTLPARLVAAAQNALEVAVFGGLDTGTEPMPHQVVASDQVHRLRRYGEGEATSTVLLVPPLMLSAEVYDVSPATSAVRALAEAGIDPWVVDFGAPEREQGGLERTLTDHVVAVSRAVERAVGVTGRPLHLAGYSQGGMFCYQAAAYRRSRGIKSLLTFGSPVDTSDLLPAGLPEEVLNRAMAFFSQAGYNRLPVPAWASRVGFRLMDPAKTIRSRLDFLRQLHDREALLEREDQRRFLAREGWVAWPGPALAEMISQFVETNRMMSGGFVIEDRLVTLADITSPVLAFVGEVDQIARPAAVRAIQQAAPRAEVFEATLAAGHFGLVVGSSAKRLTWPTVAGWVHWRDGAGERPAAVAAMAAGRTGGGPAAPLAAMSELSELATGIGAGTTRQAIRAVDRGGRAVRNMVSEAFEALPRLNRLSSVGPSTRVSMGLLLDEQAAQSGDGTFFLFEDRGYTYRAAKQRIDNVVRGLISVGVRQGEHVGVLMATRPSALAAVAAISRLGAVAVLMRPDGSPVAEARLGQVNRIIADPEQAELAAIAGAGAVLILGGGGGDRDLGPGVIDMERIDPGAVALPAWYRPNPGRGRDLAFILFTGRGETIGANRITNRRWALSAFGTATAAGLRRADTVYCVAPLHHPAGLLTSIGGAVAGGSRLALTASFDPTTFWDEVRRYGATVVSYTWTLLRQIVDAPFHPGELHHPIRLFLGSGMPTGLWRRSLERFAPARVLEFYASTEGEAVLVNLSGRKVGAKGRRLPGSAQVRIAGYDLRTGRLRQRPDGYLEACPAGEVGMLLVRLDDVRGGFVGAPLRGVFASGDAWQPTGDLFRRDHDGDYWLVDHAAAVIRTPAAVVPSIPVEDALSTVEAVDLAVAYAGRVAGQRDLVVAAAVTLREGATLDAGALTAAVEQLAPESRPAVVKLVEAIPVTTWYRPIKPAPGADLPVPVLDVWRWDHRTGRYRAGSRRAHSARAG